MNITQCDIFRLLTTKRGGLGFTLEEIVDELSKIGYYSNTKALSETQRGKKDGFADIANIDVKKFYDTFFTKKFFDKNQSITPEELNSRLPLIIQYLNKNSLTFPDSELSPSDTYQTYVLRMLRYALPRTKPNLPPSNNVFISSRKIIEEQNSFEERLRGVSQVRVLNFAATTLLYEKPVSADTHHVSARKWFERQLNEGTRFHIILPREGSFSEEDAAKYKICETFNELHDSKNVMKTMRTKILKDMESYHDLINIKFTECALPYALMILQYDKEPSRNHVKVDLYSPYLDLDSDRRSFIIYEKNDSDNYQFFLKNFNSIWRECE